MRRTLPSTCTTQSLSIPCNIEYSQQGCRNGVDEWIFPPFDFMKNRKHELGTGIAPGGAITSRAKRFDGRLVHLFENYK